MKKKVLMIVSFLAGAILVCTALIFSDRHSKAADSNGDPDLPLSGDELPWYADMTEKNGFVREECLDDYYAQVQEQKDAFEKVRDILHSGKEMAADPGDKTQEPGTEIPEELRAAIEDMYATSGIPMALEAYRENAFRLLRAEAVILGLIPEDAPRVSREEFTALAEECMSGEALRARLLGKYVYPDFVSCGNMMYHEQYNLEDGTRVICREIVTGYWRITLLEPSASEEQVVFER